MKSLILGSILLLSLGARKCGSSARPDIPPCIQARIDSIQKEPLWNPPATVYEYSYGGKRVFLFSSDCCDHFNNLYDEECRFICAPTGGITGKGDKKCPDFATSAKQVKLVWKDERQQ